ncbi:MAG: formylglycine-generating enzyme family protein [Bacteroidetes bacterium]|nr:formylglycine-generating enzyme family protein [Bacteroidota bacterium]
MKKTIAILLFTLVFQAVIGQSCNTKNVAVLQGSYIPMYNDTSNVEIDVEQFNMDVTAVTNQQYLAFVKANPQWQKSKVKRLFAEASYLSHWQNDTLLGPNVLPDAPVVFVSWFAAKAYSHWCGRALPTVDQWEYAARADHDHPNGNSEAFKNKLLRLYESKHHNHQTAVGKGEENYWGLQDMHGLIWEWNLDFNSVLISGESRKDGSLDRNLFCAGGSLGSVDPVNYAAFLRYAFRGSLKAHYCLKGLGFRTVNQ